jgi:hypothetical protein
MTNQIFYYSFKSSKTNTINIFAVNQFDAAKTGPFCSELFLQFTIFPETIFHDLLTISGVE